MRFGSVSRPYVRSSSLTRPLLASASLTSSACAFVCVAARQRGRRKRARRGASNMGGRRDQSDGGDVSARVFYGRASRPPPAHRSLTRPHRGLLLLPSSPLGAGNRHLHAIPPHALTCRMPFFSVFFSPRPSSPSMSRSSISGFIPTTLASPTNSRVGSESSTPENSERCGDSYGMHEILLRPFLR